jgi:hypothetical protein
MTRQNLAATEVVESVAHEDKRKERHRSQAKAATKRNVDPATLGGAENRRHDETETADALKRAARGG